MSERKISEGQEESERLKRLEREGVLKLGTCEIPDEFWESEGPADPERLVLEALIEDRRQGR